jgi:hypothetical protein
MVRRTGTGVLLRAVETPRARSNQSDAAHASIKIARRALKGGSHVNLPCRLPVHREGR